MKNIVVDSENYLSTFVNQKLGLHSIKKYKHWFPIYSSPKLAGIVADVTGDGHVGQGIVQFISKDKENVIRFEKEVKNLFDVKSKIRKSPSNKNTWECLIGGNAFSKILRLSGAPFGDKVKTGFCVPEWIFYGSKDVKKRYVQRLFDCEGSVILQEKAKRIIIKINMYKSSALASTNMNFLNQIKSILSDFGIKTTNCSIAGYTKRKDGITTIGYEFQFYGTRNNMESVKNFKESIDFESRNKKEKLIKYLNFLSNASTPRHKLV